METWSSTVRRRAWINSSRHRSTLEDQEGPQGPEGPPHNAPFASTSEDDVFSDGKIENWLLGCGSGSCSENSSQLSFDSVRQTYNFADDLGLGADAFNGGKLTSDACSLHRGLHPPSLNLGHSVASSCLSNASTWKSTSSVSEVLDMYSENAEETLLDLGFGCEEPQVTVRIPPRFFTFPSQARGINFRLFLDSQLQRIREEDPSLSLASRFRQVKVLTEMANAFYSLYAHVSRTPVQKLATPELNLCSSPVERIERFRSSVRSEPRSPVERLKDTVNKMCLYTGSPRGSDSTSPQRSPSKRSSLPDIVEVILKNKTRVTKKLDVGTPGDSCEDVELMTTGDGFGESGQTFWNMENSDCTMTAKEDDGGEEGARRSELHSGTLSGGTSLSSTISGETEADTEHQPLSSQTEPDACLTPRDTATAEKRPVSKVTKDLICPQINESLYRATFCCQDAQNFLAISSEAESNDKTLSQSPHMQTSFCPGDVSSSGELARVAESRSPVLESSSTHFSITVTGWEGDDASCSSHAADSSRVPDVSAQQTCEESLHEEERRYLDPRQGLQPVNSFELEEVHSAGEEDSGGATSTLSMHDQYKGAVVRGDSVQSDSSGYADEEVGLTSDRYNK